MSLPAASRARRGSSSGAWHSHHQAFRKLPYTAKVGIRQTFLPMLLPYVEQSGLVEGFDRNVSQSWLPPFIVQNSTITDGLSKTLLMAEIIVAKMDRNASWDGRGDAYNDDMANPGSMFMTINTPNSSVPDAVWCVSNGDRSMPCVPASGANGQQAVRSRHPGGVDALLADGSVRFFTDSVPVAVWRSFGSPTDGEITAIE